MSSVGSREVSVCCMLASVASHLIVKGYRALEITEYEIGAVGRVVRNVPTLTNQKSPIGSTGLKEQ